MKEYIRTKLTVTEFEAEDVITTSGVPAQPDNLTKQVIMNSPNYQNNQSSRNSYGFNWTLWQ